MGDLILCNYPIAAMPFYIEAFSGNIYSLEELCYYIEHNIFLLEEDLFEEDLFFWMEKEVGAKELANALRLVEQEGKGIAEMVALLWKETGYWDVKEAEQLIVQLKGLQQKSLLERRKLRADRYVENQRYFPAILEYRKILQMEEECKKNPILCGDIWHNQGLAFARLFLFREAKECFLTAFKFHREIESVHAALIACLCLEDEEEGKLLRERYDISDSEYLNIVKQWHEASQTKEILTYEAELEALFEKEGQNVTNHPRLKRMLLDWQKNYQKNSR